MNYKFKKKNFGADNDPNPSYEFGVDLDSITEDKEFALDSLDWWGWTPEIIQKIIDKSNKLTGNNDYTYQVEGSDFFIAVKKSEVLMWARESRKPDITWSFNKFITFMQEFKKFVEKNS